MSNKPKVIRDIKNVSKILEMNNSLQKLYLETNALMFEDAKKAAKKMIEGNEMAITLANSIVEYLRITNPEI